MARLSGDSNLEVILSARDEASSTLASARKEFEKLKDSAQSIEGPLAAMQTAWLKYAAGVATAMYTAKKAWDFAMSAARFEEQRSALDNLARQYDTNSYVMINAIQRAAQGTIAQIDAIIVANKGLIMGLNPQQLAFFTDAAERLSGAIGGDTVQAFETLTQAVATGQQRLLRQLGIIIDLEAEYKKYGHELSIAEKQTINFETVSRALNMTFAQMGPDIDTAADKMERLTAKMKDLKMSMGQLILQAAGVAYGAFFPAGLEDAFAQAERDSKNLYRNLDELNKKAKELAAEGLTIYDETKSGGFGDRSGMMKLAAWQTQVNEMYMNNLNQVQDRTQMMNLAIALSEQEKSQSMFASMAKIEERAEQMSEHLQGLSQERILFSEEEVQVIAIQNQQHEWMVQARAKITGIAYQAMEQQMLSLVETGKFSAAEFAKVVMQQVKMELVGIAARAAVQALWETAMGLAATATYQYAAAAMHYASASVFAQTAAAAGVGAFAVNAITGPGAQRSEPGTAGGYPIETTGDSTALTGGTQTSSPPPYNITVYIQGNVIGQEAWVNDELIPAIEEAVKNERSNLALK